MFWGNRERRIQIFLTVVYNSLVLTQLPGNTTGLATQGSGENLDRTELRQLEEMIESGQCDLLISEVEMCV